MRVYLALFSSSIVLAACGSTPQVEGTTASRIVLYRNGIGYFERDAIVTDGHLSLAVRNHELDDVLTTLAVVDRGEGAQVVPVAALPPPPGAEDDDDTIHRLEFAVAEGTRRVRVAWATQTPAWRVSYRLVLPATDDEGPGHLSGWAVVDNTTARDWEGVELTLATAEPLSFAVDLRTPRYVERPDVTGYIAPRIAAGPVFAESFVSQGVDRDADGILDSDDLCPDDVEMYNGIDDDDGCPDRGAVMIESSALEILQAIYFESESTALRTTSEPILDAVAATLRGNPQLDAELHGHADTSESSPYRLAVERAGAVREALLARGVDGSRLSVRGFGATRPIDPRATQEARERNRRVGFEAQLAATDEPRDEGIVAREMAQSTRGSSLPRTGVGGTRYTIGRPIDIPAGRSALVAAVSVDVTAEEVFLYRPERGVEASDEHPFRAARVDNVTDVDLVPGPVALYGHGRLLGQGMLSGLRAGEDVIIPWALDDATRVSVEAEEESTPVAVVSVMGSRARLRRKVTRHVTYTAEVGRHAPERMLIRHEPNAGGRLVEPPPGTELAPGLAFVPLPIASDETSVLRLTEERFVEETIDLRRDISMDLAPYLAASGLSATARARFDEIRADRAALRQNEAQRRGLGRRLSEHGIRTAELRAALEAMPDGAAVAAVRRRLARQLASAVDDGEALSAELADLSAREVEARGRLRAVSAGFSWPARPQEVAAADPAP